MSSSFLTRSIGLLIGLFLLLPSSTVSFVLFHESTISKRTIRQQQQQQPSSSTTSTTRLYIQRGTPGRSAPRGKTDKSKRQYRVGELVRTELAHILHSGLIKGKDVSFLEDDVRSRISIVSVDVSPDLRQARVSVSIRNGKDSSSDSYNDSTVDKRRAYSWLVENTKPIRHTLAQRMSHLKTSPNLSFVQVDVSAAVDVMYLIEKVSKGYERQSIGEYGGDDDTLPLGILEDDEEDDDDGEWEEEDDEFFNNS
ncbi:ribosome-binding factor A [Nitzschia inconspicua]|uniref:Ribosome-binding factor A n=1 Tax=Nitzschia inconspicua TaxID=303405 RepID=A0A9K3LK54_9STRA|nr:ribosome-binding factor A [Nitzschia inconspicua]KAG7363920.1 ribosome-binding factor A [Nitzschia inconspicua]